MLILILGSGQAVCKDSSSRRGMELFLLGGSLVTLIGTADKERRARQLRLAQRHTWLQELDSEYVLV